MTKFLIAEDDLMIADMTEELLLDHGYEVCGIARTVTQAVDLAHNHKPDLILLDLRLAEGELGRDVVEKLSLDPFPGILYATGNIAQVKLSSSNGHACLIKPFRPHDLIQGLEIVAGLVATGRAQKPFPKGFVLLDDNFSVAPGLST